MWRAHSLGTWGLHRHTATLCPFWRPEDEGWGPRPQGWTLSPAVPAPISLEPGQATQPAPPGAKIREWGGPTLVGSLGPLASVLYVPTGVGKKATGAAATSLARLWSFSCPGARLLSCSTLPAPLPPLCDA